MSLIKWSPQDDPFKEMEDIMRRMRMPMALSSLHDSFVPTLDMYEEGDNIIVEAPLAGIDPKDVEVSVEKGVLTVQGEHKREHEVDEKNYYRKETRSGSFYRQIALPTAVKEDDISAEYEDGILRVSAPKAAPTKAKKVQVKVSKKKDTKK